MPLYIYKCGSCDNEAELFLQVVEAESYKVCPDCSDLMKKQVTAPGRLYAQGQAPIIYDSKEEPDAWAGSALAGKDMANPHDINRRNASGERSKPIMIDVGHHPLHGAKKGSRTIRDRGV